MTRMLLIVAIFWAFTWLGLKILDRIAYVDDDYDERGDRW